MWTTTINAQTLTLGQDEVRQVSARPNFFSRLLAAVVASRQRAADREVERFLADRSWSDATERAVLDYVIYGRDGSGRR